MRPRSRPTPGRGARGPRRPARFGPMLDHGPSYVRGNGRPSGRPRCRRYQLHGGTPRRYSVPPQWSRERSRQPRLHPTSPPSTPSRLPGATRMTSHSNAERRSGCRSPEGEEPKLFAYPRWIVAIDYGSANYDALESLAREQAALPGPMTPRTRSAAHRGRPNPFGAGATAFTPPSSSRRSKGMRSSATMRLAETARTLRNSGRAGRRWNIRSRR
mgnify:CR=1 FL=1